MSDNIKFCTECGAENAKENLFCTECGHKLETEDHGTDEQSEQIIRNGFESEKTEANIGIKGTEKAEETTETKERVEIGADEQLKEVTQSEPESEETVEVEGPEAESTGGKQDHLEVDELTTHFQQDNKQKPWNKVGNKIISFVGRNKRLLVIGGVCLVAVIGLFLLFFGSVNIRGTWETSDEDYYDDRRYYTASISRRGNVEVVMEHADELNGTVIFNFSIEEDETESTDTRTVYAIRDFDTIEFIVPSITYEQARNEALQQFASTDVTPDINEGSNEVTITYDLRDTWEEEMGEADLERAFQLVGEDDLDNAYYEDYIIFDGLFGREDLFDR